MRWVIGSVYLLHFASIATLLVGGFGLLAQVKGVGGYDVNPNFAKRILSQRRIIALGMWGVVGTGLILAVAGLEMGFVATRLGFPRRLSPGLFLAYLLLMILLITSTFHPMMAITYRIVPAIMAKPGNLPPEEAGELVRRLRVNAVLLNAIVLATLAAGALRWLYASALF